jgi:TolB protein
MARRNSLFPVVLLTAVAATMALAAAPAQATFPGPNGRIAFTDLKSGQIYAVNPNGSGRKQLTHTAANRDAAFPSWSPNGKRLVFSVFRTDTTFGENEGRIWIMHADGTHQHQLADDVNGFRDYTPRFTPGGDHIIFTRCQPHDGVCAIWAMRADGTHKRALTPYVHGPSNEAVDFGPSVSPDGKSIAFTRFFADGFLARIFIIHADGSDPHPVTPPRLEGGAPDWSPTGHRIAFNSNAARNGSSIFTMRPDGSDIRRITPDRFPHNDVLPTFSPQGDRIAFASDRNYPHACCIDLFAIDPSGGGERRIFTGLPGAAILDPAWGPAPPTP